MNIYIINLREKPQRTPLVYLFFSTVQFKQRGFPYCGSKNRVYFYDWTFNIVVTSYAGDYEWGKHGEKVLIASECTENRCIESVTWRVKETCSRMCFRRVYSDIIPGDIAVGHGYMEQNVPKRSKKVARIGIATGYPSKPGEVQGDGRQYRQSSYGPTYLSHCRGSRCRHDTM